MCDSTYWRYVIHRKPPSFDHVCSFYSFHYGRAPIVDHMIVDDIVTLKIIHLIPCHNKILIENGMILFFDDSFTDARSGTFAAELFYLLGIIAEGGFGCVTDALG